MRSRASGISVLASISSRDRQPPRWIMRGFEVPSTFESLRLRTNGIELHAVAAGPSEGPLVILLHGFPEFWYGWRHQLAPLADARLRLLAPDQRGYNLSDK